jgi:hypothetical protein
MGNVALVFDRLRAVAFPEVARFCTWGLSCYALLWRLDHFLPPTLGQNLNVDACRV